MVEIPFFRRNKKALEASALPDLAALQHVAIIMDGNNRWARQKAAASGHSAGAEVIRKVLSVCQEQQIGTLTLFAFSSENWQRPDNEVQELMALLKRYLQNEVGSLHEQGICLRFVGRRDRLSDDIVRLMVEAETLTQDNLSSTLVMAIDYGGRWDITQASVAMARAIDSGELDPTSVDEKTFSSFTSLSGIPEPDLCIRTGGEQRISNFLLWDFAYTELYFTETLWPDFDEAAFRAALADFAVRQRRFGKTSEQVEVDVDGLEARQQS